MEYIGARYVTKIYENSLDPSSAEWEAGVNYEPLIIVTFNNGSYMSKKVVPASVGDPAANPDYWTQTGFYNGQIAMLQDEIDKLNNNIKYIDVDVLSYPGSDYDAQLKNAIADVAADTTVNGARIFLPAGEVRLSEVDLPSGKSFEFIGYGMNNNNLSSFGTIIKPLLPSTSYIFGATGPGRDYNTFRNITFDGESSCPYAIHGDYLGGALIERCAFLNFTTIAVETHGICHLNGNYFKNPGATNCVIYSDSYVTNNEFSVADVCLEVQASGNRIIGNLINTGTTYGLKIKIGGSSTAVNNNLVEGNYFGGSACNIYIEGASRIQAFGNMILGNMFEMSVIIGSPEAAIKIKTAKTSIISENIFRGSLSVTAHDDCITVDDCEYIKIMNNHYYAIKASGIVMNASININIDSEQFEGIQDYIIQGTNCTRFKLRFISYEPMTGLNTSGIVCTGSSGYCYVAYNDVPAQSVDGSNTYVLNYITPEPTAVTSAATLSQSPTVTTNKVMNYKNRVVSYDLHIVTTAAYSAGQEIAQLPSGSYPTAIINVMGGVDWNAIPFEINTAGKLYSPVSPIASGKRIQVHFCYLI